MLEIGALTPFSIAISHFGSGLALLLAITEALKKKPHTGLVILGILGFSILVRFSLAAHGLVLEHPITMLFSQTTMYCFGPAMLFTSLNMAKFAFEGRNFKWQTHLIIPAISLAVEIYFQLEPTEVKRRIFSEMFNSFAWNYYNITTILGSASMFSYMSYIVYHYVRLHRDYDVRYAGRVFLILLLPIAAQLFTSLGFRLKLPIIFHIGMWMGSGVIVLVYIYKETAPGFFENLRDEVQTRRYANTQLNGINLEATKQRLVELMDERKLYHDEALRLASVAEELLVSSNQLSRIINEQYGKNFYEFVNSYRVEEAKRLLLEDAEETVLSIGFRVGFSTKATFNAQFAKLAKMTPTEFRKKTKV